MTETITAPAAPPAARHPLIERLFAEHGFAEVTVEGFDAFVAQPGHTVLFFSEDPVRFRETLDLAVILPELARAFAGRFRAGVLLPEAAKRFHPRYGFRRWPAFVLLRAGEYVGAIDGVRNWDEYVGEIERLLVAQPTRPPSIPLPVAAAPTPAGRG